MNAIATQLARGGNGAFASPLLDPDIEIPDGVTDPAGAPAPKRYGVYRNNVVVSLMEALKSAYPSLLVIMGEENFTRVARNFIVQHPPHSAMMQTYGQEFAGFLDGFAPLRKSPFLGDVARVERAWLEAYHARDDEALTPGDLDALAPDEIMRLRLSPHPATFLMQSQWPVADLFNWRNVRPSKGADLSSAQCVVVSRPALNVKVEVVEPSLFSFLSELSDSVDLGTAAAGAIERHEGFDLPAALAFVLSSGLFSKQVTLPE
jgi:hypothetical protein